MLRRIVVGLLLLRPRLIVRLLLAAIRLRLLIARLIVRLRSVVRLRLTGLALIGLTLLRRLGVVFLAVEGFVAGVLARRRRRLVVRILLPELLLRRGDQAEVVLGVLIMVLGGHRIAGALRVAGELQIFLG